MGGGCSSWLIRLQLNVSVQIIVKKYFDELRLSWVVGRVGGDSTWLINTQGEEKCSNCWVVQSMQISRIIVNHCKSSQISTNHTQSSVKQCNSMPILRMVANHCKAELFGSFRNWPTTA